MDSENYVRSQSMAAKPVTVRSMVCSNGCIFNRDDMPPAFCGVYRQGEAYKPAVVLRGGDCPSFREK